MKSTSNRSHIWAGALALAMALAVSVGSAAPPQTPLPNQNAYQRDLPFWLDTYWNWYYAGADPASGVVDGYLMMPLPNGELISGSWTPEDPALLRGQIEITLAPGTPFVLPIFALIGERYDGYPEEPDDPMFPEAFLLGGVQPLLTIDGQTIISDANKGEFYASGYFDPIIPYETPTSSGAVGAVYFQSGGIVSPPLKPGVHVIHLYEPYILPGYWGIIYDNTWIVTVEK
jgi:hypothetical protein